MNLIGLLDNLYLLCTPYIFSIYCFAYNVSLFSVEQIILSSFFKYNNDTLKNDWFIYFALISNVCFVFVFSFLSKYNS